MESLFGSGFKILEDLIFLTFRIMWEIARLAIGKGHETLKDIQANSPYIPSLLTTGRIKPSSNPVQYSLRLPATTEWDSTRAYQLVSQLVGNFGGLCLCIAANKSGIMWQIVDYWNEIAEEALVNTVSAIYPEVEVTQAPVQQAAYQKPFYRMLGIFGTRAIFPAPIPSVSELKDLDPLKAFTQAISDLAVGERIVYTLAVVESAGEAYKKGESLISRPLTNIAYPSSYATQERREVYKHELSKEMQKKLQNPLYHAFLLVEIDTATQERAVALAAATLGNLCEFSKEDFNGLIIRSPSDCITRIESQAEMSKNSTWAHLDLWLGGNHCQITRNYLMVLDPWELASLWHLPHKEFTSKSINWIRGKRVPVPRELAENTSGICLGDNVVSTTKITPVYLPYEDRMTHAVVIGKTGVGKTNFLHSLIAQDIANGKGVLVLDPLGALVTGLLRYSIPPNRENDVVVLDINNEEFPPPFNVMARSGEANMENANILFAIFEKSYPEMRGTQWSNLFRMSLFTLWGGETSTIRDIRKVITDRPYRKRLLDKLDSDVLDEFWDDFDNLSSKEQRERLQPILHRVQRFYGNPHLYAMTCHPDALDIASFMRQRKIILVNLNSPEGKLPNEDKSLLGSLLFSLVQIAAMSGACRDNGFFAFADEAQSFVTSALPTILSRSRQFNLSLTLATQYLHQLVGDTLDAVKGDVGTWVFFQLGDDDAPVAARYAKPEFDASDLMQMDRYQAAVRMRLGEKTLPAFSLSPRLAYDASDKDLHIQGLEREARIREHSRVAYTPKSKKEIMAWLKNRYPRSGKRSDESPTGDDFSDPA